MFQFTHPHEVQNSVATRTIIDGMFQFTSPHGVRPFRCKHHVATLGFNSRAHTECDELRSNCLFGFDVSTHAHARSATGAAYAAILRRYFDAFPRTYWLLPQDFEFSAFYNTPNECELAVRGVAPSGADSPVLSHPPLDCGFA